MRTINDNLDDASVIIDLKETISLKKFKRHLILQAGLAQSQEHKYLLWIFLAINENELNVSDFSQIASAIVTDKDLHECVLAALHLHSYLVLTL